MKKVIFFLFTTFLIFGCKNSDIVPNEPIPAHDSLIISSKFVKEDRVINVWTPPNYNKSTESFPVLYMPDVGIEEDFPHIPNTLAKLIKENKIPPYILVGIENTERRRDLSKPTEIEYDLKYIQSRRI